MISPSYLRYVYVGMDANFRLKNQLVSSYSADPGLGIGMAYFVPREEYEEYVLSKASAGDVSRSLSYRNSHLHYIQINTCVGFQALAQANTRSSVGLRYTGVAGVSCGRSEMLLPNGVGNLQKGERFVGMDFMSHFLRAFLCCIRYANMDYVFGSAISLFRQPTIIVGYDISCQWHANLLKRIESDWPEELRPSEVETRPVVGKLHEPAHRREGHDEYSCNFAYGLGLTDFECLERIWAGNNGVGNATKTYGPGTRQDVLDDHFGFWNWEKYKGLGWWSLSNFIEIRFLNLRQVLHSCVDISRR